MLNIIPVEAMDVNKIIDKLKRKTNLFDYKTEEQFRLEVASKKYVIWADLYITVLGEFLVYPTGIVALSLTVVNVTDDTAHDLQASLNQIEQEAKAVGVNRIILDGRMGWKKVFPDYKIASVILTKEI